MKISEVTRRIPPTRAVSSKPFAPVKDSAASDRKRRRRYRPLQYPEDTDEDYSASTSWLPPQRTTVKLMMTGATVGTLVDSLHNQILLEYHVAPIQIPSLIHDNALWMASSWTVPPLLSAAYVILGSILPRFTQKMIHSVSPKSITKTTKKKDTEASVTAQNHENKSAVLLRQRALWAVTTTAAIVKLSDILERHPAELHLPWDDSSMMMLLDNGEVQHLIILFGAAVLQWWTLDRTAVAFVLAAITAYGGPLAELPFVANNVWTYLPEAAHYYPWEGSGPLATVLQYLWPDQSELAISYVSAPCYFAVTMDAIALGRWFDVAPIDSATRDDVDDSP